MLFELTDRFSALRSDKLFKHLINCFFFFLLANEALNERITEELKSDLSLEIV